MALEARCERGGNFGVPLRRVLLESFRRGGFIGLAARLVEAQLDHRDIRVAEIEEIVERGLCERELDLIESFERFAEVNQHQIALVAELRIERRAQGRVGRGALERTQRGDRLGRRSSCVRRPRSRARPSSRSGRTDGARLSLPA